MMLEKMLMAATSDGYSPNAVKFDGTNDYLSKASALTGVSASKKLLFSVWFRHDTPQVSYFISSGGTYKIDMSMNASGTLNFYLKNSASTTILTFTSVSTGAIAPNSKWYHLLFACDLSASTAVAYLNDTLLSSSPTITNDNIDFTVSSLAIGADVGGGFYFGGALAEFYFAPGQYLDLSSSTNRRKFIDASGLPVSLGSDGSTPTGTAPAIYLKGDSSAFGTNSGSGGNFTVNGTLEKASTTPATVPAWNAVKFDGASDNLTKATDLTGIADGKKGIFSLWFKRDSSSNYGLFRSNGGYFEVSISGDAILITGYNAAGTILNLNISTGANYPVSQKFYHVLASWDLSANASSIYVNGTSDQTVTARINDNLGYSGHTPWTVAGTTSKFNGAFSEFYFAPGQYLDLSVQANREKFILNGAPVSLGSDGSTPTGVAPAIYLPNRAALVGTNAGSGGDFTINGAPKDANSTPVYYYAEPATFDGTNDYLTRGADLTGVADGKAGTLSCWLRKDGGDGVAKYFFTDASGYFVVGMNNYTANTVDISGLTSGAALVLKLVSNTARTASAVWFHVLASWDLATGVGYIYINNASDLAASPTLTNDTINYAGSANWGVGAFASGTNKFNGCIADLWFDTTYLDISQSANRAKFIDQTTLRPVSLGAKGELPTGSQPLLYLGRDFSNFQTNLGSGGNFTVTGALTRGTTSPSDVRS